jgi:hypothetical protein
LILIKFTGGARAILCWRDQSDKPLGDRHSDHYLGRKLTMTSPDNPNRDNATKSLEINSTLINRRNALRLGLTSVLTVALVPVNPILAAETKTTLPPVDPTNATAKALGYVEDATKTDIKKYKQYKAKQAMRGVLANCFRVSQSQLKAGARAGSSLPKPWARNLPSILS